jgi:peptide/histidine transporter 3/4
MKLFFFLFIFKVYIAAIRNRNLPHPADSDELYEIEPDKEAAMEMEFLPHRDIFR